MMKRLPLALAALSFIATSQAQADQCSVNQLQVTSIKNIMPASSFDSAGTDALALLITKAVHLQLPGIFSRGGRIFSAAVVSSSYFGDPVNLNDPINVDFQATVADVITIIDQTNPEPDQLVVRVNGTNIVPLSSFIPYETMPKGRELLYDVRHTFRGAATLQLLERDPGSRTDDLGSFTYGDNAFFGVVPVAPLPDDPHINSNSGRPKATQYNIVTDVTLGKLEFNINGTYSFNPVSGFDHLTPGETQDVTFTYTYKTFPTDVDVSIGVTSTEQTATITVTGTDGIPFVSNDVGGSNERSVLPPNDTVTIFAANDEDGSIYEVTYNVLSGVGSLEDIPEFITCSSRECWDNTSTKLQELFNPYHKSAHEEPFKCPLGYDETGYKDAVPKIRHCRMTVPQECNQNPVPLTDISDLIDGDIITLWVGRSGEEIYLGNTARNLVSFDAIDPSRIAAQWLVKKLPNGNFALRGQNGKYLSSCSSCNPRSAFAETPSSNIEDYKNDTAAQFNIVSSSLGPVSLQNVGNSKYLVLGDNFTSGFDLDSADQGRRYWGLSVIPRTRIDPVIYAANRIVDDNMTIKPLETWVIEPDQVLTINYGNTLTVEGNGRIENNGTIINNGTLLVINDGKVINNSNIVNNEIIRLRDGGIDNPVGSVIDNSGANHIQNFGTINNEGYIVDPWGKYFGDNPVSVQPYNGYYLGSVVGERSCGYIDSPLTAWDEATNTCTLGNAWLRGDRTLTIASDATLVLTSTMTNSGSIINNGTINNTGANANFRQCNSLVGNAPTTPGQMEEPCIISAEEQQCIDYAGAGRWNSAQSTCNLEVTASILFGDVLTVRNGITWNVSAPLSNYGSIHIEEGGLLYLSGPDTTITNNFDGPSGYPSTIINYGTISIGSDTTSTGIDSIIENDTFINNYGTVNNLDGSAGYIFGEGNINNYCGSVYSVDRAPFGIGTDNLNAFSDELCRAPDFDSDGIDDELDAFPYDPTETTDTDGDGFGDDLADAFPLNSEEHIDTDGDCGVITTQTDTSGTGCGDNSDAFYLNAAEQVDTDGDCGNPTLLVQTPTLGTDCGDNSDAFPTDITESVDTDGDGVGDNSDAFPGDMTETADSDGDGTGDVADAFPHDAQGTRQVSVDNSNGWSMSDGQFSTGVLIDEYRTTLPDGVELPQGMVSFALAGGTPGANAVMTITYPQALDPTTAWWKFGPTAENNEAHWYVFDGAVISGNTVTLTITDGGAGDDDLTVDGNISDPGGPGNPEPVVNVNPSEPENTEPVARSSGGAINLWFLLMLSSLLFRRFGRR